MESVDYHQALALLHWQIELGATEAICDAPVNRYEVPAAVEKPKAQKGKSGPVPLAAQGPDVVAEATQAAAGAATLDELRAAMAAFEHCELKRGARKMVFSDGTPGARVMIVGEAPGRDEDREGRPFVGRAGVLLAMMKPFLARHIALAKPEVLVIVGNWSAQALLGKRGITRLRGQWTQAEGLPALPMFHPAYLLRSPEFKREAWADLLSLKAKLTHG